MNPWYLPKGSVRALLAGALVGSTIYLAIVNGGEVSSTVATLTAMVVTYYFKTREGG